MTVVQTPRGPAEADWVLPAGRPTGLLVLGHGAGGSVDAPDVCAVRDAARAGGFVVARVTQPYRVAGRRAPPAAPTLDEAWTTVVAALPELIGAKARGLPLIVGGRSSGARVACRTARAVGAVGVVALAFPLHPPGRPEVSRAAELDPGLPTLVVNGDRDPFGVPEAVGAVEVTVLAGEKHDLKRDPAAVGEAVAAWLRRR
ncbi:alpha/beta hydrolase [Luedemannella flava]|uniref:Alpha/beta hydrolase n=1 Tax=Luedemannella flava TaxID=349316 RepID=A0ABP4YXI4_9ACTN